MRSLAIFLLTCALAASTAASEVSQATRRAVARIPRGGVLGLCLARVADGTVLSAHAADRRLSMASLTKLFVSAAALAQLGPNHVFRTRVHALGPVTDGSCPGLAVVGGGDPCLDEHFTDGDPDTVFHDWAARLAQAGVERIDGDLVIDGSMFSGPIRPPTYPSDARNVQRWYCAPSSAFAWNDNCIEVRVVPSAPGERARVQTRPRSPRITVDNNTRSVASGGSKGLVAWRHQHANTVVVNKNYSATTSWFPFAIHEDPDLLAGDHLAAILADNGIALSGSVRRGTLPPAGAPLLFTVRNPIAPALDILNQRSQNFYGEQILRVLGHARHGTGSLTTGIAATTAILGELGLDSAGFTLLDGSGLSYGNKASARCVVDLLVLMAAHPHAAIYHDSLKPRQVALPGGGTLTIKVKTGHLAIAHCLAGYITDDHGRRYAFACIANRASARSVSWGDRTIRAYIADIVAALRG